MTLYYDAFLSHSGSDKSRVRRLAERLRGAGLRIWFDEWIIPPGGDLQLAIEHGLEQSRVALLCMSEAFFRSEWATAERSTCQFRDPNNHALRMVPVLFGDCQIPDMLRRFLYIDWRTETDAAFLRLVAACRGVAPTATPPVVDVTAAGTRAAIPSVAAVIRALREAPEADFDALVIATGASKYVAMKVGQAERINDFIAWVQTSSGCGLSAVRVVAREIGIALPPD